MRSALIVVFILLCLLAVAWLSHAVPPTPRRSKSVLISGIGSSVERDSVTRDIIIRLTKAKYTYYINRGMESKLNGKALDSLILNQPVSIAYYTGGWHPLGINKGGHICEIVADDKIIYTEFLD